MSREKPVRTRPVTRTFRLKEDENKKLNEMIKLSGLTAQGYILKRVMDDKAIVFREAPSDKPRVVVEGTSEMRYELKRCGSNLNQTVANLNLCLKKFDGTELEKPLRAALKYVLGAVEENRKAVEKVLKWEDPDHAAL